MPDLPWILMPVLVPEHTEAAISDCLAQSTPCRLLVINQGVDSTFRARLERIAEDSARVFLWSHEPPLPSLSATWNRALDCVWEAGADRALVINNDVRLAPNTLEELSRAMDHNGALFVSAVGVTKQQFTPGQAMLPVDLDARDRGGPDFSCFLIHRACHARWRFDEHFIPAYCEDLDYHRRLMLDGHGDRIFSINLPYLHFAAGTLKHLDDKRAEAIKRTIEQVSRAHYARKWGGPVNQERFRFPFDPTSDSDEVTTPQLQQEVRRGQTEPEPAR